MGVLQADGRFDRRRFLIGGAGAAAGAGLASLPGGAVALAAEPRAPKLPLIPAPEPIPGGLPVGLPPPYDLIHVFLPGPPDVILPFSGSQLMGLDVEPSAITDFRGTTALGFVIGSATGSDGVEYGLEVDIRAYKGEYVAADGSTNHGTFGFVWIDLFEPGTGSQVHDYNGGIPPSGLFWTVQLADGAVSMSRRGTQVRLRARDVPIIDTFQFAGVNSHPATVDFEVAWEATGPAEELGSGAAVDPTDPAAFLGTFAPARAIGSFSGAGLGFRFTTNPGASSDLGYAEFGTERNGSFL